MNDKGGYIVEYMINSPCNLSCPFCFGPDPKLNQHLTKQGKLKLLEYLAKNGVKHIVIAGGEPTLDPDLLEICKFSKQLGIKISLQTNGFYPDVLQNLFQFIDFIALPLDGLSDKSQLKMRTSKFHFETTKSVLEIVKNYNSINYKKIKTKIGTVLTKFNIDEVKEIANFLNHYEIDVWKIYQIRKRGNGIKTFLSLNIDEIQASNVISSIKELYNNLPILYSSGSIDKDGYIIIDPDASCYVIKGSLTKNFGRLLDKKMNFEKLKFEEILEFANLNAIKDNTKTSFPGWI